MKVRMTQSWRGHQPGTILDLERGVADIYVNVRRVAVLVEEDEHEEAAPAVEFMVPHQTARVKKKG